MSGIDLGGEERVEFLIGNVVYGGETKIGQLMLVAPKEVSTVEDILNYTASVWFLGNYRGDIEIGRIRVKVSNDVIILMSCVKSCGSLTCFVEDGNDTVLAPLEYNPNTGEAVLPLNWGSFQSDSESKDYVVIRDIDAKLRKTTQVSLSIRKPYRTRLITLPNSVEILDILVHPSMTKVAVQWVTRIRSVGSEVRGRWVFEVKEVKQKQIGFIHNCW